MNAKNAQMAPFVDLQNLIMFVEFFPEEKVFLQDVFYLTPFIFVRVC